MKTTTTHPHPTPAPARAPLPASASEQLPVPERHNYLPAAGGQLPAPAGETSPAGASPLTAKQKGVICITAGRSYNKCGAAMGYHDVTEWRHATTYDVTGKTSLTDCDQLDYIPLINYHNVLLGLPLLVDRTPRTPLERALMRLDNVLKTWGYNEEYAATLMRARLGVMATERMPLDFLARKLGAERVHQICHTIINRGRAKVAAANKNNGFTRH